MANKNSHIDDFLTQKLETFEAMPDAAAWESITAHLEHLSHPVDQSLNRHLADLSEIPEAGLKPIILSQASMGSHPIDLALHEKLSVLETIPDRHVYEAAVHAAQQGQRTKKRFALWFSLFLTAGLSMLFYRFSGNDRHITNQTIHAGPELPAKNNVSKGGSTSSKSNDQLHANGYSNQVENSSLKAVTTKRNEQKPIKNVSGQLLDHLRRNRAYSPETFGQQNNYDLQISSEAGSEGGMSPEESKLVYLNLNKIPANYQDMQLRKVIHPKMPRKRLSRLSVNLQAGMTNERVAGRQLRPDKVHKDAPTILGKNYGHSSSGDIFSVNFGYRINRRFTLKIGFQHSSTVEKSTINYVFTDAPVYDQTKGGILAGYITRPAVYVNEKVSTTTSTYAIPVQVYARIFEIRKLSLWTGLGGDFVLSRNIKGRFFSFDDGAVKAYRSYTKNKLSPHLSMLCIYHVDPFIALTGNMQLSYLDDQLQLDKMTFVKQQLMPSLRLGILFTPVILVK